MKLKFLPEVFRTLKTLCAHYDHEIGCFGITSPDDPLLVIDLAFPKQKVSATEVDFDEDDVSRIVTEYAMKGHPADQITNIWIHTHPGSSAKPSGTDEKTFANSYSSQPLAVMFILAKGGETFTRIRTTIKGVGMFMEPKDIEIVEHKPTDDEILAMVEKVDDQFEKQTHLFTNHGYGRNYDDSDIWYSRTGTTNLAPISKPGPVSRPFEYMARILLDMPIGSHNRDRSWKYMTESDRAKYGLTDLDLQSYGFTKWSLRAVDPFQLLLNIDDEEELQTLLEAMWSFYLEYHEDELLNETDPLDSESDVDRSPTTGNPKALRKETTA